MQGWAAAGYFSGSVVRKQKPDRETYGPWLKSDLVKDYATHAGGLGGGGLTSAAAPSEKSLTKPGKFKF